MASNVIKCNEEDTQLADNRVDSHPKANFLHGRTDFHTGFSKAVIKSLDFMH